MAKARRAVDGDAEAIVQVLAASHEHYVWEQWLLPEEGRLEAISRLMSLMTRLIAIPHGEVWIIDGMSAALWLSPDPAPLAESVETELNTNFNAIFGDRRKALDEVDASVRQLRPAAPHWTLGTMGTSPEHQGRGFGTAVLAPKLELLDERRECAALETSSNTNVRFYERLGFVTVAFDEHLPHGAPPVWSMWREPR